jgi:hypothetical protein
MHELLLYEEVNVKSRALNLRELLSARPEWPLASAAAGRTSLRSTVHLLRLRAETLRTSSPQLSYFVRFMSIEELIPSDCCDQAAFFRPPGS